MSGNQVAVRDGVSRIFSTAALWTSQQCGRASTFILACTAIVAWAVTGPVFGFSDTWQLVINTGTTIITFLMVFLIQNTQNRDMSALHLKLDELIRVNKEAHNKLLNLEDLTEEELAELKENFTRLAAGDPDLDRQRGRDDDHADAKDEIGTANARAPAQVEHRGPGARRDRRLAGV
jgi:low affinity Fe/Cu permease